jgi:hypothetical protein
MKNSRLEDYLEERENQNAEFLRKLEPSLWNSKIGRRVFLKRAGAATAGTAIALHGFRMEVLASVSTNANMWHWSRLFDIAFVVTGQGATENLAKQDALNVRDSTFPSITNWSPATVADRNTVCNTVLQKAGRTVTYQPNTTKEEPNATDPDPCWDPMAQTNVMSTSSTTNRPAWVPADFGTFDSTNHTITLTVHCFRRLRFGNHTQKKTSTGNDFITDTNPPGAIQAASDTDFANACPGTPPTFPNS